MTREKFQATHTFCKRHTPPPLKTILKTCYLKNARQTNISALYNVLIKQATKIARLSMYKSVLDLSHKNSKPAAAGAMKLCTLDKPAKQSERVNQYKVSRTICRNEQDKTYRPHENFLLLNLQLSSCIYWISHSQRPHDEWTRYISIPTPPPASRRAAHEPRKHCSNHKVTTVLETCRRPSCCLPMYATRFLSTKWWIFPLLS